MDWRSRRRHGRGVVDLITTAAVVVHCCLSPLVTGAPSDDVVRMSQAPVASQADSGGLIPCMGQQRLYSFNESDVIHCIAVITLWLILCFLMHFCVATVVIFVIKYEYTYIYYRNYIRPTCTSIGVCIRLLIMFIFVIVFLHCYYYMISLSCIL
jgi:hypothetical protein